MQVHKGHAENHIGNRVRIAFNGREGLNILRKEPSDLAIIDWNMPVMTGIELLDKIREDREHSGICP